MKVIKYGSMYKLQWHLLTYTNFHILTATANICINVVSTLGSFLCKIESEKKKARTSFVVRVVSTKELIMKSNAISCVD